MFGKRMNKEQSAKRVMDSPALVALESKLDISAKQNVKESGGNNYGRK